ncbi:MAG: xanthine dehydrogenase family protein [Desulfomonile tiedjei]|nr:xanthine dehydrogenase family protein [Desulfomonile tiedjei]
MGDRPAGVIGEKVERIGSRERLLGKASFAADIDLPEAVHLVAVRSERPHARIVGIDVSRAQHISECLRVFTAEDVPGRNRVGIIRKDQPLLADDKVRCIGDPVALVAAETLEAAREAAAAIRVEYEDISALFDPEEALRPGAPLVHADGNLLGRRTVKRGNPEAAFKHADVVVERVYTTAHLEHAYLEPDAGLGYMDGSTLVIHASTQNPHYDQKDVAELLGLDEGSVRIIQAATGGGFGSKLDLNVQGFVGLAAYLLNRPARMVYTREEAFLCTPKRHPLTIAYKSAANRDGRLLAADIRVVGDTGAYASYGPAVLNRVALHATGPYELPNLFVESVLAYTNNPTAGAMRGFGVPQIAFAHESQMDLLAAALGMSPLEIRLRNCYRIGSLTASGQELTGSVGIRATLDAVAPQYAAAVRERNGTVSGHIRRGVGIGSMMYGIGNTGQQNPATAHLELTLDGGVVLYSGAADVGQGSSTVLAQIAAAELGLQPEAIRTVIADTLLTTSAGATSASRQTYISGNAVLDAARKLKEVLLTEAADMLKFDRAKVILEHGSVRAVRDADRSVSFAEIARRCHKLGMPLKWQGFFDPDTTPLDLETGQGVPYATYAFATHVAEVSVDTLTGEVRCLRVVAAHDVGKAVNPQGVHGQICGGVAMGIGFALMEEFVPGQTESLKDYHIPSAADMPEVIPIIVEDPEPTGPFGAKGVGEPALVPTAPAILNAIADALGVRIYDLPAGLERVLQAALSARKP